MKLSGLPGAPESSLGPCHQPASLPSPGNPSLLFVTRDAFALWSHSVYALCLASISTPVHAAVNQWFAPFYHRVPFLCTDEPFCVFSHLLMDTWIVCIFVAVRSQAAMDIHVVFKMLH